MHIIILQIVFEYFVLCFLIFITIKIEMKTAKKVVNNLINENIFQVSLLRQDV